jgi:hypothetical protein
MDDSIEEGAAVRNEFVRHRAGGSSGQRRYN